MLIKDQFLLQHISYKVRGYFVADIFSANYDCFLPISPASHHNLSKDIIGIIIRSLWGLSDLSEDIIRMDSSNFQQKFITLPAINSGDIIRIFWYQPRGSAYSFSSGCHMISYHQSFRRITSEFYYRDRFFQNLRAATLQTVWLWKIGAVVLRLVCSLLVPACQHEYVVSSWSVCSFDFPG
jgi:hypothetical protein